jgi:hypothetical protein
MMDSADMNHIQFTLTKDEWDRVDTALSETPYLLHHVHHMCDLLSSGFAGGFLSADEPGVTSILELCGRAFKAAALQEGEALAMLESKVRASVGDNAQRRADKLAAAQKKGGWVP